MNGESTISVMCSCGEQLQAPASAAGTQATCPGCGAALLLGAPARAAVRPPPIPAQVLSYRNPQSAFASAGPMWREGNLAVSHRDVSFPMRCVKCNAPLQARELRRTTMYWQHPAYLATLCLGFLIGALIILCVRKKPKSPWACAKRTKANAAAKFFTGG